ncbi:Cytosolic sulfotransferase 3 [Dissostichus eleginoides]|uniref:Sulfotransferase n=1 Tax=Dissostichus eleginoides TaxID=100907 RepID=A0AAD9CE37_DISEL|nr:Cytosolic sulfotransferase 3 [Dissostichus eleginoides]
MDRPTLFDFHGVSMIKQFTDSWEEVQNFKARPDDIVIVSYPKSGTTWVCYLVELLFFGKTCPERLASIPLHERVPFLEISRTSPTPVQFLPKSFWEQNSTIVYVARNAKDTAVSYYHFCRMNYCMPEPADWSTFLQNYMEGKVSYGSWYDHVSGWWEKKQSYSKLAYMFYEDLSEDTGREMHQLCSFLGLSLSAEEKENVLTRVKFDNMKTNKMTNFSTIHHMDQTVSPFMRKGKVGDWKNLFTVSQDEKFDEDYKQKMKNPTLQFYWRGHIECIFYGTYCFGEETTLWVLEQDQRQYNLSKTQKVMNTTSEETKLCNMADSMEEDPLPL